MNLFLTLNVCLLFIDNNFEIFYLLTTCIQYVIMGNFPKNHFYRKDLISIVTIRIFGDIF